jgi:3-oxoadipate CoA-transferase beta subunit
MSAATTSTFKPLSRAEISYLVAHDFPDGSIVNLGIGMPTQVADYLPQDREILLHSENGILGMGRAATQAVPPLRYLLAPRSPNTRFHLP